MLLDIWDLLAVAIVVFLVNYIGVYLIKVYKKEGFYNKYMTGTAGQYMTVPFGAQYVGDWW